jgi:demethylmenaquinone methyltransferase/2-methoxy-6-polyprenyl-1,4-benzoquinol methylase
VRTLLVPGGRVFFIDSLQPSTAALRATQEQGTVTIRRLNDGREFRVVKLFYEPAALQQRLQALGWKIEVQTTPSYFLYGSATRP